MSAIFGILRFDGGEVNARDLERMGNTLAHRGPDGRRFTVDGPVGLGHCLLRVNQEDLFERQPLVDREADLTLVADCRIDNRKELAEAFGLSAADTRDMPDSAFILRAYKKWGEDAAEHLLGDFTFAIWDGRAKKLVLGRDHMGQRYFHYHTAKNFFAFATEIKALWAVPDVPRRLSEARLATHFLSYRRPRNGTTFFEHIAGVLSGTILSMGTDGRIQTKRYWEPHADPRHEGQTEAYYIDNLRSTVTEAVACRIRRLIARPALLLSAGFDSGAIAGLSGPILTAKGMRLTTVSAVLPEGAHETARCPRQWVEMCRREMPHLDVRYFVPGQTPLFTEIEKDYLVIDGIPNAAGFILNGLLREAADSGARLIMDGFGGDETINPRGGDILALLFLSGQVKRFITEFRHRRTITGLSIWRTLRHEVAGPLAPDWAVEAFIAFRRGFASPWSDRLVAPAFASEMINAGHVGRSHMDSLPLRAIGRTRSLNALRTVTQQASPARAVEAAARGLEVTRPMRDKRVVEFGLAVPRDLSVRNGLNRHLTRRALADVYPREFQTRDWTQHDFIPDVAGMFRAAQPMMEAELARFSKDSKLCRYFDFDRMREFMTKPVVGQRNDSRYISILHAIAAAQYLTWLSDRNA